MRLDVREAALPCDAEVAFAEVFEMHLGEHVGLDGEPGGKGDLVHGVGVPGIRPRHVQGSLLESQREDLVTLPERGRHGRDRGRAGALEPVLGRGRHAEVVGEMAVELGHPQVTELHQVGAEPSPHQHQRLRGFLELLRVDDALRSEVVAKRLHWTLESGAARGPFGTSRALP